MGWNNRLISALGAFFSEWHAGEGSYLRPRERQQGPGRRP